MRIINGKVCKNSEDKRKAVEEAGGQFNEAVEGDYVQGSQFKGKAHKSDRARSYVEVLGDEIVEDWM